MIEKTLKEIVRFIIICVGAGIGLGLAFIMLISVVGGFLLLLKSMGIG